MLKNQDGFTLVEIIAVLILLSILASVAYTKFDFLGKTASERMADMIVQQMTTEALDGWTKAKFNEGWVDDAACFALESYTTFKFQGGISGGNLYIEGGDVVAIKRIPSTNETPAKWSRIN